MEDMLIAMESFGYRSVIKCLINESLKFKDIKQRFDNVYGNFSSCSSAINSCRKPFFCIDRPFVKNNPIQNRHLDTTF